jgi:hypothetical protein
VPDLRLDFAMGDSATVGLAVGVGHCVLELWGVSGEDVVEGPEEVEFVGGVVGFFCGRRGDKVAV